MKVWRKIPVFLAMLVLCICMINIPVSAASNTQDGLKVTLTTDKDTYSQSDEIKVNISVENTNSFDVNNVSLESIIPDGLELKKDYSSSATIGTLTAGDSYKCELVLQQREESVPVEGDENVDSEDSGEGTSIIEDQSSQTSTSIDKNSVNQSKKTNESDSVQTGDYTSFLSVIVVLILSAIVIVLLFLKKKNKIFLLLIGIVGSTIITGSEVLNTKAAEEAKRKSIDVVKTVSINNREYELAVKVSYTFDDTISLKNLSANLENILIGSNNDITFTVQMEGYTGDLVELYCDNRLIGQFNDDGNEGDDLPNDNIYTCIISAEESVTEDTYISYVAKANGVESNTLDIFYYNNLTEEEYNQYLDVRMKTIEIEDQYRNDEGYISYDNVNDILNNIEDYVKMLVSQGIVQDYEKGDSDFYIKLNSGIGYVYTPEIYGVLNSGTDNKIITLEPVKTSAGVFLSTITTTIDKWYNNFEYQGSYSVPTCANMVTECNDSYTYYTEMWPNQGNDDMLEDQEVTIESLKNLSDYSIVIWEGHGAYTEIIHSALCTSQQVSLFSEFEPYSLDIKQDRIIMTKGAWNTRLGSYYGITSKFIEKYYEGKNNAIIYLGACQSGKDNVLANAFLSKGASAVYCYDETVSMEYEMIMRTLVFYGLTTKYHHGTEPYTTADALAYAQSICGTNDPFIEESTRAKLMLIKENDVAVNEKDDISTDNNEGTVEYGGHKYKFYDDSMSWEEAKAFCEEQGGHLVTITSADEQNAIYQYAKQFDVHSDIWIGISDAEVEGDWSHWITGEEVTFTNWGTGEPDNYQGIEQDYGVMCMEHKSGSGYEVQPGQWDDIAANGETASGYFICEWDNNETVFEAGDGSEENPYQVSNAEQLDAVRNDLTAHYIQVADIDMSGYEWSPIGTGYGGGTFRPPFGAPSTENIPFEGEYNGNNYKITNLSITENEHDTVGLFGLCSENSKIENITIENLSISVDKSSTDYVEQWENGAVNAVSVGGIAGRCESIVSNCKVSGNIEVINCNSAFVGGILGYGGVIGSSNYADIYVLSNRDSRYTNDGDVRCGGVTGHPGAVSGTVGRCTNYGNIDAISGHTMYCGGISGNHGAIEKCVNYGDVNGSTSNDHSYSNSAGNCNVGGIVGATSGQTLDSVNYGRINGDAGLGASCYAGGVAGKNGYYGNGIIENCFNVGDTITATKLIEQDEVIVSVAGEAGRIAGRSQSTTNCYSVDSTLVNGGIPDTNIGADNLNGASLSKEDIESMVNQLLSSN